MTWFLQRVLDLIDLIVSWFTRRRYRALARQVGRDPDAPDGRRGLILVQIDGLAHKTLLDAMNAGALPHLKRLLERDDFRLEPWWCGIPSSTPVVQSGLMYGNNWDVPAFRWYDKASGRTWVAKNPRDARQLQDRLSQGRTGLLEGGSSYVNIFDGGARLSLFTVSALGGSRFFENARGMSLVVLMLLSPLRLLRTVAASFWEFIRDLWQRLVARFDTRVGQRRRPFSVPAALLQIVASIIFRELQTFGVLLDIYRRVPAVYTNYYGYDDVAHQLGPLDGETLRVLRGIDRGIREIDVARRRFADRRAYDLVVLSDHGMSPCTSFKERYGQTLGELVASLVARQTPEFVLDESSGDAGRSGAEARFLLSELEGIKGNLAPRGQKLVGVLENLLARGVPAGEEQDWDLARHGDIILRNSGTISLVYFPLTAQRMDMSEIEMIYPGLLRGLEEHPGLGLVLGCQDGHAMTMTVRGPRRLRDLNDASVYDLLDNLPDRALVVEQLCRLLSFPSCGDLVLLGRWNSRGQTIAFEPHWATHGGLGGEQNRPFILLPPAVDWDIAAITGPEQLYPLFMERYGGVKRDL